MIVKGPAIEIVVRSAPNLNRLENRTIKKVDIFMRRNKDTNVLLLGTAPKKTLRYFIDMKLGGASEIN